MARTTSSISFYCRPSKANKKGFSPIEICIIINSKRVTLNLPRKEEPEIFQKEIRKRTSKLNQYLDEVLVKINDAQTDLMRQGKAVTASALKEYIQSGGVKTYTLQDLFNDYNSLLEKRIDVDLTIQSYKKYERIERRFLDYFGPQTEATAIRMEDISNFYAELNREEKMSTSASKMQKLKTIFRYAFDNGHITIFPFNGIKLRKGTPNIEYLTMEELNRIAIKDFKVERINRVRDLFLFQASTGLAYSDLVELKPEDVQYYQGQAYIKKKRVKTDIEYTTVIFPLGLEIWNKYGGHLPILTNQRYNTYLKEIADICHIDKDLHTHLARKTFATMLLSRPNMKLSTVAKMLGHSTIQTTQKHYAKVLDTSVFEEAGALITR